MSAVRLRLGADRLVHGDGIELRIDDDFPPLDRPITLHVGSGCRHLDPAGAEALAKALADAAKESRDHWAEAMRPAFAPSSPELRVFEQIAAAADAVPPVSEPYDPTAHRVRVVRADPLGDVTDRIIEFVSAVYERTGRHGITRISLTPEVGLAFGIPPGTSIDVQTPVGRVEVYAERTPRLQGIVTIDEGRDGG